MSKIVAELIEKSPKLSKIISIARSNPKWSESYTRPLVRGIYQRGISSFQQLTFLPTAVRVDLDGEIGLKPLAIEPLEMTQSQQCVKALFQLHDRASIETVWMTFRESQHSSVCVSSQVGCALRCSFCATGAIGFKRQLTLDEIVDQVVYFSLQSPVNTVSFMGMGEALLNPRVIDAIKFLNSPHTTNISLRKMSVSTVGIIPGIQKMTRELPQVNLAFSLHSPFPEQRNILVPMNKTYPLPDIMQALEDHVKQTNRKVFLAYLLLPGYNDTQEHAKAIGGLLSSMPANIRRLFHVNLLRYNPAEGVGQDFERTSAEDIKRFSDMLSEQKIRHTLRQSFGLDIDAACGQLYGKYQPKQVFAANMK